MSHKNMIPESLTLTVERDHRPNDTTRICKSFHRYCLPNPETKKYMHNLFEISLIDADQCSNVHTVTRSSFSGRPALQLTLGPTKLLQPACIQSHAEVRYPEPDYQTLSHDGREPVTRCGGHVHYMRLAGGNGRCGITCVFLDIPHTKR